MEPALLPPRTALQDVSDRINHSPVKLAPIGNTKGKPWEGGLESADGLRAVLQTRDIAVDGRNIKENASLPSLVNAANEHPSNAVKTTLAATMPVADSASKKRKSDSETSLAEDIAAYKQNLDHIEVDDMYVDMNCAQVRKRINQVLDGGIMKKGEFCKAIGSSNQSLNTFLQKRGMDGANTDSYTNAWAWFKQRELAGLKMPDVKKRQKAECAAAAASGSTVSSARPAPKRAKISDTLPDLSQIRLDGEETDSVPVFDSADEIRKKISAHLRTPGLTQAQFCRDLYAQLNAPTCKSIRPQQLTDFRAKKGPLAGCTSSVFYAAYVYFEKLRIAQGKPKSAHRMTMESVHPVDGVDREHDDRHGYLALAGSSVTMDQYGCVHISR